MRRPAKPFAVEVRKSKKSGEKEPPLRSGTQAHSAGSSAADTPAKRPEHLLDIDRVFARFAPSAPEPDTNDAPQPETVFTARPAPTPIPPSVTKAPIRILPDLSVPPKTEEVAAEARPKRAVRAKREAPLPKMPAPVRKAQEAKPKAPKRAYVTQPAPRPIVAAAAPVAGVAPPAGGKRIVIRRRARPADATLRPGERWKRRLHPAAR